MKFFKYLLCAACVAFTFAANAQSSVGQWIIHSKYVSSMVTNCVDAGDYVYYLVSNSLYRYDKATQENETLDKSNYLNDTKVTQIYYNYDKKYLVVAYENANLDIFLNDGKIVNMSDIKDALMTIDRTINDITFATDKMYIATAFGYVVIDDNKWEVKESRVFNQAINTVAQVGDYILLVQGTTYYYGLAANHYDKLADYKTLTGARASARITPINDTRFFLSGTTLFGLRTIVPQTDGTIKITATSIVGAQPKSVQRYPGGFVASFGTSYYYTTDANGDNRVKVNSGAELYSSQEQGNWWVVGADGLTHVVDGVTGPYIKPNALSIGTPVHMVFDEVNDQLYVCSTGTTRTHGLNNEGQTSGLNTLKGSTWADAAPKNLPTDNARWKQGWYFPILDPNRSNQYYLMTWWKGVYTVKDGVYQHTYDPSTAPLDTRNYNDYTIPTIDAKGNMWIANYYTKGIFFLPASKVGTATAKTDWVSAGIVDAVANKNMRDFISTRDNFKFYSTELWGTPLYMWTDNGNVTGPSDVTAISSNSLTDQDGKSFGWNYIYYLFEDKGGRVWVGTDNSLAYINPAQTFATGSINCVRPKINREDGTGMADYLLDGVAITGISCDAADNKWIATLSNGAYQVSPDGSKILNHFTSDNSSLPSDVVYEVCCNTNNNSVYFTTSGGFAEYKSTSIVTPTDYSNVSVFPNPVRPEYTGLITIKGLMANSHVKIADNAGNVVKQLKSDGSTVTWDGCNDSGDRVSTGVYFIFASQSDSNASGNAVAKVLVVR